MALEVYSFFELRLIIKLFFLAFLVNVQPIIANAMNYVFV